MQLGTWPCTPTNNRAAWLVHVGSNKSAVYASRRDTSVSVVCHTMSVAGQRRSLGSWRQARRGLSWFTIEQELGLF